MSGVRKDVWIVVDADCPMTHEIEADGGVHIMLGSNRDGAHLVFEPAALARVVELARGVLPGFDRDASSVPWLDERRRAARS